MSLILDALRKMEEERAARRGGSVDIRPALLSRHGDEPPRTGKLITLVAAGAILLLAGIGAGVLMRGTGPTHPVENSAARTEDSPIPPLPPASPQTTPAPTLPAAAVPAVPTAPPPRRPVGDDPSPPAAEAADTALAISGIAWQEERGLRRAVVNGALVGEGAEVAGARIIEIRERSVKFSRGGRTFEVSYASAFPSR
jgi:general secretion pathway protein B